MRRVVAIISILGLLTFPTSAVHARPEAEEVTQTVPQGARVQTYKGGLSFPVDMAWVPGTRKLFFTEKNSGKVRVLVRRRLRRRACVNLDVASNGERGALGITLHPRFKKNKFLYVYYTKRSPLENRVTRFIVKNNRCTNPRHVVRGIRSSSGYHNGGQLQFMGGKLFISTGEAHQPARAQETGNRLGKILRVNPNGSIPKGNPFGNAVWSYGHRNPFGLGRKPGSNVLYSSENGPNCDDELNIIRKGRNYGWGPNYRCGTAGVGPNPKPPIRRYSNIIVPTDLWWYRGRMKRLSGSLYMGDFRGHLRRFRMNGKGTRIRRERVIHRASAGIVDVSKGPGGWLYFMTPSAIYRIIPD